MERFHPHVPLAQDVRRGICLKVLEMPEMQVDLVPGEEYQCTWAGGGCEYAFVVGGITTARRDEPCEAKRRALNSL